MRIVLIQPPIQDFYETEIRLQPIGLASIKATLLKHLAKSNLDVFILDAHRGGGRRTIKLPKELEYLKTYYALDDRSPFRSFHNYYHFGIDFDQIEEILKNLKADLVGISMLFTPYYREALEVASRVKKLGPIPVVVGGSHVSALPEFTLNFPQVDFAIKGEGELPMLELVEHFLGHRPLSEVSGLGYKKDGIQVWNPTFRKIEIEDFAIPNFSDLPPENYLLGRKPMTFLVTSRSCPHRCSFCSVHLTFGYDYRRRSVESVLAEIKLRHKQGYRVIDFEDDNLTFYKKPMKELCRQLMSAFPNGEMEYTAMNGISYLSLDVELLELMWQAGFRKLNLALVSSDTSVRESTKRPHTVGKYLEVVAGAKKLGFEIVSYQILGLPQETLESQIQTMVFNSSLPVLLGSSQFYQTPNSPIARDKVLNEEDYFKSRLTAMAIASPHFERADLYTLFVTTRILNFLKGLDLPEETTFNEFLSQRQKGAIAIGQSLLRWLLEKGELLVILPSGKRIKNESFKAKVFAQVWNQLEFLGLQNGKRMRIDLKFECEVGPDFLPTRNAKTRSARVESGSAPPLR